MATRSSFAAETSVQDPGQFRNDTVESFGSKFAADVETQKGFKGRVSRIVIQCQKVAVFISTHLDHRMDGELNGVTESVEGHRCRIDQESHVVDYRFDNRERARLSALALGSSYWRAAGIARVVAARRGQGARARSNKAPQGRIAQDHRTESDENRLQKKIVRGLISQG